MMSWQDKGNIFFQTISLPTKSRMSPFVCNFCTNTGKIEHLEYNLAHIARLPLFLSSV